VTAPRLYLYDDAEARCFEPFALTRPIGELRAGALIIRERWERSLGLGAAGSLVAEHLSDFEEPGSPPAATGELPAGAVVANSRCVVPLGARLPDAAVWRCGGRVAAVRLARATPASVFAHGDAPLESLCAPGGSTAEIDGRWLSAVWDFIASLVEQLREDIAALGPELDCVLPEQAIVIGGEGIYIERGAVVEPAVCFDVSVGPVLVRRGSVVRAFTRLVGPCAIGEGVSVLGDRVAGCSIGETSVVHGEMSETIVLGHANKSHDGFVGHSYLGRWSNLGAGTITSNLKNTYGSVQLWTPQGVCDTSLLKLGSFVGDHVKTGIGTRLTTGSVIGAGSNIYGSTMPPRYVPPFSWGEGDDLAMYRLDKFLATAERAMSRRGVELSERERRQLAAAHALSWEARG
jgi:UDP-N-acetylglucosamine diphosphorylase/glucosamine-1-phosphate N-acetyltransferase